MDWDNLRKEARSIENQLDAKLTAFSKLGSNFSNAGGRHKLSTKSDNSNDYSVLCNDIEKLLER